MNVAVLITCFNRVQTTLSGLEALFRETSLIPDATFHIFLVDDNSPDSTGEAVRSKFPSVNVTVGTGALFWNGGMCLAFEVARAAGKFDAYLLFNDDVELFGGSVASFVNTYRVLNMNTPTILAGATCSTDTKSITYSGFQTGSRHRVLSFHQVLPSGSSEALRCDTFNGNFVLVPGEFFEEIGGLDPKYRHGLGDLDLGLVASRMSVEVRLFGEPIGLCDRGESLAERASPVKFSDRWRLQFADPHGPRPYLHFAWKHRPRTLYVGYAIMTYLKRLLNVLAPIKAGRTL